MRLSPSPATSARPHRQRATHGLFLAWCLVALAAYGYPRLHAAQAEPAVPAKMAKPAGRTSVGRVHLAEPALTSASAILIDANSGRILYAHNPEELREPASTTKIMTALLALEQGNLASYVQVTPEATMAGGSSLGLEAGETVPLRDLIEATMIRSGNDGASAIAEAIGGSEPNFLQLMNAKAQILGMSNTTFANPHGMPMPGGGNMTTALDLARLGLYAMKNEGFRQIVAQPAVRYGQFGHQADIEFVNTNKLLTEFPLCTGIKTGYTNNARHCLVASAQFREAEVLAVILGAEKPAIRPEMVSLFDYGLNQLAGDYWLYRKFSLGETPYEF